MQPLSRVRRDTSVIHSQKEAFEANPHLAMKVMRCIAEWSEIEHLLAVSLALILGANQKAAMAIYNAIGSRNGQIAALRAAAEAALDSMMKLVFLALVDLVIPIAKMRDRFAHWNWAHNQVQVPDALFLIEPDEKIRFMTLLLGTHDYLELDRSQVFVVREPDLDRIIQRQERAKELLGRFLAIKSPIERINAPDPFVELQRLFLEPEFDAARLKQTKQWIEEGRNYARPPSANDPTS